ncbi:MAG: DUF6702 family protein [Bacteroidota bacterium]|nr:DUF6702 family protein [Bacteroidota bacterium]
MIRTFVLLAFLLLFGGWLLHEFYVSLTEIRYNPSAARMEVSMRIFADDLDRALLERTDIQTQLGTELEAPSADSLLGVYLLECFSVNINGEKAEFQYLGKEPEADALWCYLESKPVSRPQTVTIFHKLLTEIYPDQVNIVQVYQERWNKGLLLNRQESSGKLIVGK